jgi:DNA processing protein
MDKYIPWFLLKDVPGVGNLLYKRLLDRFQSPERVLQASETELSRIQGMSAKVARLILTHPISDALHREMDAMDQTPYRIVTYSDDDYPALLREIPDPPPYLYVYGTLTGSNRKLAVVGSRNATAYGLKATQDLCGALVFHKMAIVSGMARGIDTAAHAGALSGKGQTIAVLGSGFNNIYPPENKTLFHQIADNGAVVSEFSLSAEPDPHHFPQRNRIISGMSLGTVVVEATKNSGSLITARMAAEQNREVFAVPGSIVSHKSTGTHTLIKQGAKLVENAMDIMEEFSFLLADQENTPEPEGLFPALTVQEQAVIDALGVYPMHIDDIIRKTAIPPGALSGLLLQLELSGRVRQTPGKFFCLEHDKNQSRKSFGGK